MNKTLYLILHSLFNQPEPLDLQESRLRRYLSKNENVKRVLISRNQSIIFDYSADHHVDELYDLKSMTKSVLSLLIGIAIDKGFIPCLDQKMMDYFSGHRQWIKDQRIHRITLSHLLTMSSGFPYAFSLTSYNHFKTQPDLILSNLSSTLQFSPGEQFNYNEIDPHFLSIILTTASGRSALEFAHEYLFRPLGIEQAQWNADANGYNYGGVDLKLRANDLNRIGEICLNRGLFQQSPIISEQWLVEWAQVHIQGKEPLNEKYSLLWWISSVMDHPAIFAFGAGDQFLYLIPDLKVVISIFTNYTEPDN